MPLKSIEDKAKKNTTKVNFLNRIRYSIGMKKVNRAIEKARRKNKKECLLGYWIMEPIEKELEKNGYEVVIGDIQAVYHYQKYTYIKW